MSSNRGRMTGGFARDVGEDSIRKLGTAAKSLPSVASVSNSPSLSVLAYCGSSILMTVMNKYILSSLDFNLNFLLLCVQSMVCVIAIQTCKASGLMSFQDFRIDKAKQWFPVTLLLIGMIYTGSKALQYLSIPVYTIFKNLTIIVTAYGEVLWFGSSVTRLALFSFGLIVLSSVVAAWADIKHAVENAGNSTTDLSVLNAGYMWVLINCICTSTYVLGKRMRIKLTNFKDLDTMFYDNTLSIPVLILSTLLVEDWSSENLNKNFPPDQRNSIFFAMVLSGLSTIFISYTSAWCIRATSSTTYSMVGALNKLPIAVSGLIFFDAPVTVPSVSAIGLGFVSGIVYAIAKIKQNAKPKADILPLSNIPAGGHGQGPKPGL